MRQAGLLIALFVSCSDAPSAAQSVGAAVPPPVVPNMPVTGAPGPMMRAPLLQPLALGSSVEKTTRVSGNLRVRIAVAAAAQGPRDRIHQRIASSMIDFYPVGSSGFHLSAGTKLYDPRVGEQATNRGLMVAPKQPNVPGSKIGLKRTPALTLGYSGELAERTSIGIEVGAMKGRAYNNASDLTRRTRADRIGNPVNPMVNLVVGRRF
jgi:hypothetical protein